MSNVTAQDIKTALCRKHRGDFFLTECKSGSTWLTPKGDMKILDALAIRKSWTNPCFTGYEVKISRGDFLRDAKFYTYEELCNCLYLVCPKGMIERTELPESVGLIYFDPETQNLVTRKKAIYRDVTYSPNMLLYIIFSRLDSDRIPFYSSRREYFADYVANKCDTRSLGRTVSSRLIKENLTLKGEIAKLERFRESREAYQSIIEVCRKHGISMWSEKRIPELLDNALTKKCPYGIEDVRLTLEHAVECIKKMEAVEKRDSTEGGMTMEDLPREHEGGRA